jgi:charged multivesicular body protein 6
LFGLKQGNAVLKELHKEMSLEAVEKLMNETAEAVAYQKVRLFRLPHLRDV